MIVPQGNGLASSLTATENVLVPLLSTGVGVRDAHRRTHEALALVGLEESGGHLIEELSGGQFPVQFPSTADVVADAEAGAAAATQATIALVLAVIGLLAALVALGLTVARRSK